MFHEAINAFSLICGFLALIPLWRDEKKKLIAVTAAGLILITAGFLIRDYFEERLKQQEAVDRLRRAENAIMHITCRHPSGMNFDEIYQNVDYGSQGWSETDEAFGELGEANKLAIRNEETPSWDKTHQAPLRVWSVVNPEGCPKP